MARSRHVKIIMFKFICVIFFFTTFKDGDAKGIPVSIVINASNKPGVTTVEFQGCQNKLINDDDKLAFQIDNNILKDGIESLFGKRPDAVKLGNYNDVTYKANRWSPVERIQCIVKATVVNAQTEPAVISIQDFINLSSHKGTYKASITSEVKNSVASTWSEGYEFTKGAEVYYSINFMMNMVDLGLSSTRSLSFTRTWGESFYKESTTSVSTSSEVMVELDPGQHVQASMTATRGSLSVEVKYLTSLIGDVMFSYKDVDTGRYYWRRDISEVLDAVGASGQIVSSEILKIEFYSEAKVTIEDKKSNKTILTTPADLH